MMNYDDDMLTIPGEFENIPFSYSIKEPGSSVIFIPFLITKSTL